MQVTCTGSPAVTANGSQVVRLLIVEIVVGHIEDSLGLWCSRVEHHLEPHTQEVHVRVHPDDVAVLPMASARCCVARQADRTDSRRIVLRFRSPLRRRSARSVDPGSRALQLRLHSGPVTPVAQGTFGGASNRLRWRGRSGVDAGTVCSTSEFFTGLLPTSRL